MKQSEIYCQAVTEKNYLPEWSATTTRAVDEIIATSTADEMTATMTMTVWGYKKA